jgi:hypothetical protein
MARVLRVPLLPQHPEERTGPQALVGEIRVDV